MKKFFFAVVMAAFFMSKISCNAASTQDLYYEEIARQFEEQFRAQYEKQLQEQIDALLAEEVVVTEPIYKPTQYERDLAAQVIFAEAGNQGYYGMYLVAECIVNRVMSGLYPSTVAEVLKQPNQFTLTFRGVTDECYLAFDEACIRREHKITHFCSGGYWPSYGERVLEYLDHKFTSLY